MSRVFDVAKYILTKRGKMTTMKLQKLVYYCQVWSLVWEERPLFGERIEAWANGPVVRELYDMHRGNFDVDADDISGDLKRLGSDDIETIDAVLEFYGDKSSQWLIDLTHQEDPWRDARDDLPETARSNNEITLASMAEYYSGL